MVLPRIPWRHNVQQHNKDIDRPEAEELAAIQGMRTYHFNGEN
jgi:hypothetical protein